MTKVDSAQKTRALGSIEWTERTGGVLTARDGVSLAGPLLRDELRIAAGLLAMALRRHSGRRSAVDPQPSCCRTPPWRETPRWRPRIS